MTRDTATSLRHRKASGTPSQEMSASGAKVIERESALPPHHTLTSLSLSHVQFVPNNILSEFLAYVTLSPLAIFCGYVAVVVADRDLKPLVMFAGQVLSEGLNAIMKRIIKQARPTGIGHFVILDRDAWQFALPFLRSRSIGSEGMNLTIIPCFPILF